MPPEIEHTLIWTKIPIIPTDLPPSITPRVLQDGLWGFTGSLTPPPSPSTLPECLPALSEWGVTLDQMICSPRGTDEEEELVRKAGIEIETFVKRRWNEREWETAWFVNPPVSTIREQQYVSNDERLIRLYLASAKHTGSISRPRICPSQITGRDRSMASRINLTTTMSSRWTYT